MNFFGRKKEIEILRNERELSFENSRFTVVIGRRRIGKTELIGQALNDGNDVAFREFPCRTHVSVLGPAKAVLRGFISKSSNNQSRQSYVLFF